MGRVRIRNRTRRSIAVPGVGVCKPGGRRECDDSPAVRELALAGALSVEQVAPPDPPPPPPNAEKEATE